MPRKLTTEEFISRARNVHSDRYDYSEAVYTISHDKLRIRCPRHGAFFQIANDHLNGRGCPECGNWNGRTSLKDFIERSKRIHGDIYNYSLVNYRNSFSKVKIICPLHGKFFQTPYSHWRGSGCPKCRYSSPSSRRIKSSDQFIKEAKYIHGNLYDYSRIVYRSAKEKVQIFCPKHGEFQQTPINHLWNKHGCPKCRSSIGERTIRKWLEENGIPYEEQKKFWNCRNPRTKHILKYDFFLPEKNILIEYDGRQHYELGYFGTHHKTHKDLLDTQYRDQIKTKYAQDNNYRLIRISFKNFFEIGGILKKQLHG